MTEQYLLRDQTHASPDEIEDTLEGGEVVYFERCPIELPSAEDLDFLRGDFGDSLKTKNLSFHPETNSVPRFEAPKSVITTCTTNTV